MSILVALVLVGCQSSMRSESTLARPSVEDAAHAEQMDRYYLSSCAVCGAPLGSKGECPEVQHHGRQLRFCSMTCRDLFERDPDKIIARVDAEMIRDQRPHYPLGSSIVSGRTLDDRAHDFIWGNRLFRVADRGERDVVLADPGRFKAKLDQAVIAAQRAGYAMRDKCPVQGDILPGDTPIDMVVACRMVRVCCGRCAASVRARPYQYLAMVDFANRQRASDEVAEPPASRR